MKQFVCCLLLCAWTTTAFAAGAPADGDASAFGSDFLIFSAGADRYASGAFGSYGSFDWVHPVEAARTYMLGFSAYSVDESHWSFGKFGVAYHLNDRITLQGQAGVGGGNTGGDSFGYQNYDGSLTCKATERIYVRMDEQFFQIADSRGFLLKPGLVIVPMGRMQADLTYAHSVSGNTATQFFSGRIDFDARTLHLLGGFSFGQSTPQNLNLGIGSSPRAENFHEGFLGIAVPLSNTVLNVVANFLNLEANHGRGVTISWKMPIGKREHNQP